jgi:protein-tyrosine phosphatase
LFVCLGNICRSPLAEGVAQARFAEQGLGKATELASAGTGRWHVGSRPDPRAVAAAGARGIDISHQQARQVTADDFSHQDLILAMDGNNLCVLQSRAPAGAGVRMRLLTAYSELSPDRDVADPYYSGTEGFERVLDQIDEAVSGLAMSLRAQLEL